VPRPNGSEALERVGSFLASELRAAGAQVRLVPFQATPHGFELVFAAALGLMLGYATALLLRRYRLALGLGLAAPLLLLLEFEALRSPVSGILPATEHNVVATFPGAPGAPLLVFAAHYDTTTHFGDHLAWGRWGFLLGPATALALALALGGVWRARRGGALSRRAALLGALAAVPFAVMFWFHAVGPWLRAPSPGALDNGGSVTALLRLADRLSARPPASVTVQLAFFAAEEERALGSRAFAAALPPAAQIAVVNLEGIGADAALAFVPEDGFALRRYRSPEWLVARVNDAARALWGAPLPAQPLPVGTLTDARSFLAEGIPAVTLVSAAPGGFPRHLHSTQDARERLSTAAIERAVTLLDALVRRADADPSELLHRKRSAQ